MLRVPAVARCLSLTTLFSMGAAVAMELPLPPPGEDIVGQVQVIKAKYADTCAAVGVAKDLG
jgi:L,D-transpeptidase ErfK/SrfK